MDLLQSPLVFAAACAFFFWGAGAHEARQGGSNHGPLWLILSILVSALVIFGLGGQLGLVLVSQIGLFIGIGFFRAWNESRSA